MVLKPVIKWVGGKRQVMKELIEFFPCEFGNYHEPFLGGGSVFMELWNRGLLENKEIYLSDILDPLMNLYFMIKCDKDGIINELKKQEFYQNTKENYIKLRGEFNILKEKLMDKKLNCEVLDREEMIYYACLFLFLNKTGFNGIYRENSKGGYNVPYGKQKVLQMDILIKNIMEMANVLKDKNIIIKQCDFLAIEDNIKGGDFIYIDPPYYNTFNKYSKTDFGKSQQIALVELFKRLTERGCKVAISNSDDPFIHELYKDIKGTRIEKLNVRRLVNSDIEGRKEIKKELLILNY